VRDSLPKNVTYANMREDRVIFYTNASNQAQEIVYRIRAINRGEYQIPPAYAASMYSPAIKALGISGKIQIQ
jgi:hypothetical protein